MNCFDRLFLRLLIYHRYIDPYNAAEYGYTVDEVKAERKKMEKE